MGIYRLRTDFATHLRVILWVILVIFVVGSLYMFGARPRSMQNGSAKDVILTVQKSDVQRGYFDSEWERIYKLAAANGVKSPLQYANIKGMIVDQIITAQKDVQIAEEKGIRISKKELKAAIDEKIAEDLKVNRSAIMGQLSKEQEKLDPRKDKDYLKTLSDNGMNIDALVETAKASISELSVKAELVRKAMEDEAGKKVDAMSDSDLEDTYKTYSLDIMVISDQDSTEAKAMEDAKKAVKELKSGKDMEAAKKLVPGAFSYPVEYNVVDTPYLPSEIAGTVETMKKGDISEPVKTPMGIYIVKLNKIDKKVPAKFDAKAKKERRKAYKEVMGYQVQQTLQSEEEKIDDFEIMDEELAGYYYAFKAMSEYNPTTKKPNLTKAESYLEKASKNDKYAAGKDMILAELASVKADLEKDEEAARLLSNILDGDSQIAESYDLRMLYGDVLAKSGKKDQAAKQYEQASELNRSDAGVHQQLAMKYKEIGMADKAAAEDQKAAEIQAFEAKQRQEFEDMQKAAEEKAKSGKKSDKKD